MGITLIVVGAIMLIGEILFPDLVPVILIGAGLVVLLIGGRRL